MNTPQNKSAPTRRRHARPAQPVDSPWAASLLRLVDWGLGGIIFVAPLVFGGRHDLGRFVFVALVAATAAAWFVRQTLVADAGWIRTKAHGLLLLAVGLVALEIVPLPVEWVERLAPRHAELLPLWTAAEGTPAALGPWQTLSFSPGTTQLALAMLLAYALLFVTVIERLGDLTDVVRLLRWIGLSALLMAAFGLLQYFASNDYWFWVYEVPFRTTSDYVMGAFTNKNHFAHFLVLGFGPLVAWLVASRSRIERRQPSNPWQSSRQPRTSLMPAGLLIGLAVLVCAVLLALSRGGAAALAAAGFVTLATGYLAGLIRGRHLVGVAGLAVVVIGLLSLGGYERVAARLDDFSAGSLDKLDSKQARRKIWAANVAAIRAGGLVGAGVGLHREIYPVYLAEPSTKEFTHAENAYLQVATENGWLGVGLLIAAIGLCGAWSCWALLAAPTSEAQMWAGAATAGLAASLVHSLVDFVWYIPACLSVTIILAASLLRLSQFTRPAEERPQQSITLPRTVRLACAAAVVLVGAWTVSTFAGPALAALDWDRYLRASIASAKLAEEQLTAKRAAQDATQSQEVLTEAMIASLEQVVRRHPNHARAHSRLASQYLQRFELRQLRNENVLDATQIRDAAIASSFASPDALQEWLARAFGDNCQMLYLAHQHARRAIELNPLQGEAYLYLADLCFLDGATQAAVDAYIEQGLRVRPFDGNVLFEVGKQRLMAGQIGAATQHWAAAFRHTGQHQLRIIHYVAGRVPGEEFVTTYQPDWRTLRHVWKRYQEFGTPEDLATLAQYAATVTARDAPQHQPAQAAYQWLGLASMYSDLEQPESAIAHLETALALNSQNYYIRRELGKALVKVERFAEAEPHLRWCLARQPENQTLKSLLIQSARQQLRATERAALLPTENRANVQ